VNEIVIEGNKGKKFVIDLSDSLQRRYELVRELKLSVSPKEDICAKYKYSRVMGHLYETAWDKNRWDELKEKKNGPKSKSKRTEKLENFWRKAIRIARELKGRKATRLPMI